MAAKTVLSGFIFALLAMANSAQAQVKPRVYVNAIATTIEENYFDEARAKKIAADLRRAAAKGNFDNRKDQRELSSELSTWLDPHDTHFDVSWQKPEQATTEKANSPVTDNAHSVDDTERRRNYGVRAAELLSGNIGYLDLRNSAGFEFGEAKQPARQVIDNALELLSGSDALIIDLRDNGGGAPQMVGYLSSAFVKKGADIFNTFHGRGRTMSEAPLDWHAKPRLDTPLFILISGRTASAAEAFAYTLQSAKRAIVVGEASLGAANPGARVDAGHGFSVFVSFASPINPITRTNWEGRGVTPDVAIASTSALLKARTLALQAVMDAGLQGHAATTARWALDALQAETEPARTMLVDDYVGNYGTLTIAEAGGQLVLINGRRPIRTLLPLGEDRFAVKEDPRYRVVFERAASGRVHALESQTADADVTRYRRNEGQ